LPCFWQREGFEDDFDLAFEQSDGRIVFNFPDIPCPKVMGQLHSTGVIDIGVIPKARRLPAYS
jgi:hypothetical protein